MSTIYKRVLTKVQNTFHNKITRRLLWTASGVAYLAPPATARCQNVRSVVIWACHVYIG